MILTDYHLVKARTAYSFRDRLEDFSEDPPAELRVLVRLPDAIHFIDVNIIAAFNARDNSEVPPMTDYVEVERYSASPKEAIHFFRFEHIFTLNRDYDIRADFLVDAHIAGTLTNEPIGSAHVKLSDIVRSAGEKSEVQLSSPGNDRKINMKAEFGVEYLRIMSATLLLDVHVRIVKSRHWPLNAARPSFIMFRWDRRSTSWISIYESEVLDRPTAHPDAHGAMMFQDCEMNIKQVIGDDHDEQPLRFEFFHHDAERGKQLLGYFTTSLRSLRELNRGSELELHANTFPEGELCGTALLHSSFVSMCRHFFHLHVEFRGVADGPFVYFDLSIADASSGNLFGNLKGQRPCYKIVRYGDDGRWIELYRSEAPLHGLDLKRTHKFNVAKLSEDKLNKGNSRSPIFFIFYARTLWGNEAKAGTVRTNIEELAQTKSDHYFPLQTENNRKGYFQILQAERGKSFMYFSAHCVLGASRPDRSEASSMLKAQVATKDLV